MTFVSLIYHDEYVKQGGQWKIAEVALGVQDRPALQLRRAARSSRSWSARSVAGAVSYEK